MSALQGLEGLMSEIKSASDAYRLAENAQTASSSRVSEAEDEYRKLTKIAQTRADALYKLEQRLLFMIRK